MARYESGEVAEVPSPRDTGEIVEQLDALESLIASIDNRLGALGRLMQSILRPEGPTVACESLKTLDREISPIADRVRDANDHLRVLINTAQELYDRAEL